MKSKSALRLSGSSDDVPGLTTQASLKKVGRRSPLLAIPIFAIVLSILVWEFYSFPALDAYAIYNVFVINDVNNLIMSAFFFFFFIKK